MTIAGLVLAGGQSRRMGQEKAFLPFGGKPMIERVMARLSPQVGPLAINANGDAARFSAYPYPVLADDKPDTGPLGGVLAGLRWAERLDPAPTHLATVPVDSPFLPANLVERLRAGSLGDVPGIVIAASGERDHPVFALWPTHFADRLAEWRLTASSHGVRAFLATSGFTVVTFPVREAEPDPFLNVNTPQEYEVALGWLAKMEGVC